MLETEIHYNAHRLFSHIYRDTNCYINSEALQVSQEICVLIIVPILFADIVLFHLVLLTTATVPWVLESSLLMREDYGKNRYGFSNNVSY